MSSGRPGGVASFVAEPEGFEGLGAGPVTNPRNGALGNWPVRSVPPPPDRAPSPGFLRSGLSRVREANKSGFVLSKLQGLDERFGKHFMPSEQSDDVELVVVEGGTTHSPAPQQQGAAGSTQHHTVVVQPVEPVEESPKQPPPWLL